jgi:hypothetical protein
MFSDQSISHTSHACYLYSRSDPFWFLHSNKVWWRTSTMKNLTMLLYPSCYHFLSFRFKYSCVIPLSNTLSPRSSSMREIKFRTHRRKQVTFQFRMYIPIFVCVCGRQEAKYCFECSKHSQLRVHIFPNCALSVFVQYVCRTLWTCTAYL